MYRSISSFRAALVVVALLLSVPARANTLAVVNTSPGDGAVQVPLAATISFTFNQPVDLELIAESFIIAPENAITIQNVVTGQDGTEVRFEVVHQAQTDFTWIISGAHEDENTGELLAIEPFVLHYTTRNAAGTAVLSGTIGILSGAREASRLPQISPDRHALPIDGFLLRDIQHNTRERIKDGTPSSGHGVPTSSISHPDAVGTLVVLSTVNPLSSSDDDGIVGATVVDAISGHYQMPYLRAGTYYPYAMRIGFTEHVGPIGDLFDSMYFGYYDPDGDGNPDAITIADGEIVGGVDFSVAPLSFYAGTAAASEVIARDAADAYGADQELVGITSFGVGSGGRSVSWEFHYYSPFSGMQTNVVVTPFDVQVTPLDFPGETPPVALPDEYVDSEELLRTGLENGGEAFMLAHPFAFIGMSAGTALDLSFGGGPGVDDPYWAVAFIALTHTRIEYLIVYVDMVTGEVVGTESSPKEAGKYSDRYQYALLEVANLNGSFVLVSAYSESVSSEGVADAWQFEFYAADTDTWAIVLVMEGYSLTETESPAGQPAVLPLAGQIIDSDLAIAATMSQGGAAFAAEHEVSRIEVFAGDVRWTYPDIQIAAHMITLYGASDDLWFRAVLHPETGLLLRSERSDATSGEPEPEVPTHLSLDQNYPNPFNPQTTIPFQLSTTASVRLAVHDALGREVAILAEGILPQGTHSVTWDASHLSSGVYFYRLTAEGQSVTGKMLLQK